jgi:hypothetical protein
MCPAGEVRCKTSSHYLYSLEIVRLTASNNVLVETMERIRIVRSATIALLIGLVLLTFLPRGLATTEAVQAFGTVFVIVGENTELPQLDNTTAPYTIGTIKPESAWLTDYFAVTHHSEANYIAMTSGQFTDCQQGDGSVASCTQNVNNLFHQLDDANISWRSWMESMPQPCYLSSSGDVNTLNEYVPRHNPALFYDDLVAAGLVPSPECMQRDIPAGSTSPNNMLALNEALANGNVARFNLIIPNNCQNAHSKCGPGNQIGQFDTFLAREVPVIKASPAYGSNGVIIITFDEGTTTSFNPLYAGGNVMFAVISPLVEVGQYSGRFNHYSFLRTMEEGLRLTGFLGDAATAPLISSIWAKQGSVPEFDGIFIREVFLIASVLCTSVLCALRRRFH